MNKSQWHRAVENRCVFSARLKALSDRSVTVVLVADGSMWLVCWLQKFVDQLQFGCMEQLMKTTYSLVYMPTLVDNPQWRTELC